MPIFEVTDKRCIHLKFMNLTLFCLYGCLEICLSTFCQHLSVAVVEGPYQLHLSMEELWLPILFECLNDQLPGNFCSCCQFRGSLAHGHDNFCSVSQYDICRWYQNSTFIMELRDRRSLDLLKNVDCVGLGQFVLGF